MTIQRAIERIEAYKLKRPLHERGAIGDVIQILREEAEREVVSLQECVKSAYGYYSAKSKVKNNRVKAVLTAAGVKFKE